jgi:hypothetical protein
MGSGHGLMFFAIAGAIFGVAEFGLFLYLTSPLDLGSQLTWKSITDRVHYAPVMIGAGVLAGFVFGLVWRRANPRRSRA